MALNKIILIYNGMFDDTGVKRSPNSKYSFYNILENNEDNLFIESIKTDRFATLTRDLNKYK